MDEPLTRRDIQAFTDGVRAEQVAFYRQRAFDNAASHEIARLRPLQRVFVGLCVASAAAGWCAATHISADMLDSIAVMALMESANQCGTRASPLMSHDPHFIGLTPVGLGLIATRTRRAGTLVHIDGGKRYVLAGRASTHGIMRAADALTMTAREAE
ncbi:anti-sigma factor [Caballeronia sp. INDeC2]|uniref:anti-sigma factor n=1 Tax=Caballeronia sp. INDeC2 TaxID=2921747 RepID=UPI00202953F6|nr:anti-sigma factor [Caballeronia sp. INDeC2]